MGDVEHADNVQHADNVESTETIHITAVPQSRIIRFFTALTKLLVIMSLTVAVLYMAPAINRLANDAVDARLARNKLQDQLAQFTAQDRCEDAYARRITRATDRVQSTEAASLLALVSRQTDPAAFQEAVDTYQAATEGLTVAVNDRDAYIAGGSTLPCPIND